MGGNHSIHKSIKQWSYSKKKGTTKLKAQAKCPMCGKVFEAWNTYNDLNSHIDRCLSTPMPELQHKNTLKNIKKWSLSEKIAWIKDQCNTIRIPWSEDCIKFTINRENLIHSSYKIMQALDEYDMHKEFQVNFQGEKADDAGGLLREWVNLLISKLSEPKLLLFERCQTEKIAYKIVTKPEYDDIDLYFFTGKLLAKAAFENIPINCPLSIVLYKQMLQLDINLEDMAHIDTELYNSLKFIENNDITDLLFETFSVVKEYKGRKYIYDIRRNGSDIPVTNQNKAKYIKRRVKFETEQGCSSALESFLSGFSSTFPLNFLSILSPKQLELFLCGNPYIDVSDWESFTEYRPPLSATHKLIKWFWSFLRDCSNDERSRLLYFVTGTVRPPVQGFAAFTTQRGDQALFTIEACYYVKHVLPIAHTCFNRLGLPLYPDAAQLEKGLMYVVENHITGFGLE